MRALSWYAIRTAFKAVDVPWEFEIGLNRIAS